MGWTSHDSEAACQWLDELQGRVMLVDVVSPLEPDLADAAWSGDADQPLNAPRLAELMRPACAKSNCLEWLLNLPPDHEGRSKAAIDAELRRERNW
jgi:hypothetical protein